MTGLALVEPIACRTIAAALDLERRVTYIPETTIPHCGAKWKR